MKGRHKSPQFATPASFQPTPLTPEQLNGVDLLIQGKSDQETADLIGRDRATVWRWKTRVPLFAATLEQRREEVFGVALHRLRSLLSKAIDNIAGDIEAGDVKSSFELLKATGLHGFAPPTGETNVQKITERIMLEILAREHIPERSFDLIDIDKNPRYEERKREILEELGRGDEIA
jgi:DNA-binding CsgD family transcriptional regulator